MKSKLFLTVFIMMIFSGCVTQKKCAERFPCVASRDSIYIETLEPFPFELDTDTMFIETKVPCNDFELKNENKRLLNELKVVNGILKQRITLKKDTIVIFRTKTIEKIKEVTKPVEVLYVPIFWRITGWIGISFIVGIMVYLALKIKF